MNQLLLYTTLDCHLCVQALALTERVLPEYSFELLAVDIADSDALIERYGIRIPVLQRVDNRQELGWPFNEQQLRHFLAVESKE